MYAKLFILFSLAVVAMGRVYPPGIHPALCPDYPNCDMSLLARFTPEGLPIPEWVRNPSLLPVAPVVDPTHIAARYPADFNPAFCPNYPYCF